MKIFSTSATLPSIERLSQLLDQFSRKQVLVIGDLMADQYIYGETVRLSREAPVPVLHSTRVEYELGGAANVARYLKLLGADVTLCGVVGYDDGADHIQQQMNRRGIGTGGIFRSTHRPTILKVRAIAEPYSQQLLRIDYENTNPISEEELASIVSCIRAYLPHMDAVLVADYDKGMFKGGALSEVLKKELAKTGLPVIVDSKTHHFRQFPEAWLTIGHYTDALQHYVKNHDGEEAPIEVIGNELIHLLEIKALVLNCDDKGMALFRPDAAPITFGKMREGMYDFIGSGDALSALMALAVSAGSTLEEAAAFAWFGTGLVLNKAGVVDLSADSILSFAREAINQM